MTVPRKRRFPLRPIVVILEHDGYLYLGSRTSDRVVNVGACLGRAEAQR